MFRTLRTLFYTIGVLLRNAGYSRRCAKLPEEERWKVSHDFVKRASKGLIKATGARVIYHGLENLPDQRGILFVSNHESYFDILILLQVMEAPTAFVAKNSIRKVPFLSKWLENIGSVYIDRDDLRQSMEAIIATGNLMKRGLNMAIFPEGTRSKSDTAGEFKKGSLKPASMAKAPIVPVFIDGSHRIFESNPGIRIRPAEVHVYIGTPIDMEGMPRAEQKELANRIRDVVLNLKDTVQ